MNICKCSNGIPVTGDVSTQRSSPLCKKNDQKMCSQCNPNHYLNIKKNVNGEITEQTCIPWTKCLQNEWIQQSGSKTKNRVCKPCPKGTERKTYNMDDNKLGKISNCQCKKGYSFPIKNNEGKIVDIKCGCSDGKLKEIKKGEKDCVCNPGFHGGGKKNKVPKDTTNYKPYGDCILTKKCKCDNGLGATNISCELRSIKSITDKRVTNTSGLGECPFVNRSGNVWKPSMGPLSSPSNVIFKQSNRTCLETGDNMCEFCFQGYELNKEDFKMKGKTIKTNTYCIPVNKPVNNPVNNPSSDNKTQSNVKSIMKSTIKRRKPGMISIPQEKKNIPQLNNDTSKKFYQMLLLNQR